MLSKQASTELQDFLVFHDAITIQPGQVKPLNLNATFTQMQEADAKFAMVLNDNEEKKKQTEELKVKATKLAEALLAEKKANAEKVERLKREAQAAAAKEKEELERQRIAEKERQAERERIAELERIAKMKRISELERIAKVEREAEAERKAAAERIAEMQRAAEKEREREAAEAAEERIRVCTGVCMFQHCVGRCWFYHDDVHSAQPSTQKHVPQNAPDAGDASAAARGAH